MFGSSKNSDKNSSNNINDDEDNESEDDQSIKTDKSLKRADDDDFEDGFYIKKKPVNLQSNLAISTS